MTVADPDGQLDERGQRGKRALLGLQAMQELVERLPGLADHPVGGQLLEEVAGLSGGEDAFLDRFGKAQHQPGEPLQPFAPGGVERGCRNHRQQQPLEVPLGRHGDLLRDAVDLAPDVAEPGLRSARGPVGAGAHGSPDRAHRLPEPALLHPATAQALTLTLARLRDGQGRLRPGLEVRHRKVLLSLGGRISLALPLLLADRGAPPGIVLETRTLTLARVDPAGEPFQVHLGEQRGQAEVQEGGGRADGQRESRRKLEERRQVFGDGHLAHLHRLAGTERREIEEDDEEDEAERRHRPESAVVDEGGRDQEGAREGKGHGGSVG